MIVDLFVSLPDSLIHSVVAEWLSARAWVRLNSAFCVKSFRPQLLQLFSLLDWRGLLTDSSQVSTNSSKMYDVVVTWILKRELRTSHVRFQSAFGHSRELLELLLATNAAHIKTAQLIHDTTTEDISIQNVAAYCTQLTQLTYVFKGVISPHLVLALLRNTSLQYLCLNANSSHNMEIILYTTICCPSVTKLTLWHSFSARTAEMLVKAFSNACEVTLDALNCRALEVIARLPLKSLYVETLRLRVEDTLRIERNSFALLEELEIAQTWRTNVVMSTILANAPLLHTIKLDGSKQDSDQEPDWAIGADILEIIARHVGARLEVLALENMRGLPADGLQLLAKHCPNIRQLLIICCNNDFDDNSTLLLLPAWPKLTHLQVTYLECSAALLRAIVLHCPLLNSLTFEGYRFNVDLADIIVFIQQAHRLRHFWLGEQRYPLDVEAFAMKYREEEQMYTEELLL